MAKVLDKIDNSVFIRLTIQEYNKLSDIGIFDDDDENNFDEAIKDEKVRSKLSLLASKL